MLTARAEFCVPKGFTPFYVLNFFIPEPLSWQAHVTCSSAKKALSALGIFACRIDPVCERGREQQIFRYILTLKGTSMRIIPWRVSAFFTFAVCMSVCAASLQAQTWSAPQLVENGGGAAVSVNANGTAGVIYAGLASVKTNGVWETPVLLGSGSPASNIKVAPNGDVLAIWSFRTSNTYVPVEAQAAFFSGGRWGPTLTITTNEYGDVYNYGPPNIGFDGNSQATVVWEEYNGSTCSLVAITGSASAGFGSRHTLSNESACQGWTQLAVNHIGQAVAVIGVPGILSGPVVAISRDANGVWGAPVTLEAQQYRQRQPRIALGDDGTAVAVWTQRTTDSYAVRTPNGVWSAAAVVPGVHAVTNTCYVAVDGSGNAVVAYEQYQLPAGLLVQYRSVGGSWGSPVLLESGGPVAEAATPAGTFVVASGSAVYTLLPRSSTWNKASFSTVLNVAAAPGIAIAAVAPQVSVSTAAVP